MKPVPVYAPLLNVINTGTHRAQALPMVRVTVAELAMVGELSRQFGWESCEMTFAHDGQNIADAAQSLWKNPRYAELEAIRKPDHQPCAARCGRCSRCVHSAAWWMEMRTPCPVRPRRRGVLDRRCSGNRCAMTSPERRCRPGAVNTRATANQSLSQESPSTTSEARGCDMTYNVDRNESQCPTCQATTRTAPPLAYIVIVTWAEGRYCRRAYLTLRSAVSAVERGRDRGEHVSLQLCALTALGGAA